MTLGVIIGELFGFDHAGVSCRRKEVESTDGCKKRQEEKSPWKKEVENDEGGGLIIMGGNESHSWRNEAVNAG